jgi:excisionase family DNA binding protein
MNSVTNDNSVARESAWMTPRQAATYLGVGVNTIYDACNAGGLKYVKLGHRTIRLRRAWVDAWVERLAEVHD